MIDIVTEELISLAEAAGMLPCGRKGRYPNVKTVYAWTINKGCRGVVLESLQVAGRRCTSRQAIARFVQALTSAAGVPAMQPHHRANVSAARMRVIENELDRLGVKG